MKKIIIAVDFDGTCVTHEFPKVGKEIGAARVLTRIVNSGHRLILFTMRSNIQQPQSKDPNIICKAGNYLDDALKWFERNKIPVWGINQNPDQATWTTSPKAYAQLYIDDAALGCPLKFDPNLSDKHFVDWVKVEKMLESMGLLRKETTIKMP